MIYVDRILHWQIAKIVSVNDLMQWNIVVKIANSIWKTEYPLIIERESKKKKTKQNKKIQHVSFFTRYDL